MQCQKKKATATRSKRASGKTTSSSPAMSSASPPAPKPRPPPAPPTQVSALRHPQLLDPFTIAISFMPNPGYFRVACQFTLKCFNQAVYLEGELPVAYVTSWKGKNPYYWGDEGELNFIKEQKTVEREHGKDVTCKPVGMKILNYNVAAKDFLPTNFVRSLVLFNMPNVEYLPMHFLRESWRCLENVKVKRMSKLRGVSCKCLKGCHGLKRVVFEDLPLLDTVDSDWMASCSTLKSVTLMNLSKLKSIGDFFLIRCESLTDLVFEGLPALEAIHDYWLHRCTSLTSFALKDLPNLVCIGSGLLGGCTSLKKVSFRDLPRLARIRYEAIKDCPALASATFYQLPLLEDIGGTFNDFMKFTSETPKRPRVFFVSEDCHENLRTVVETLREATR